MVPPLALIFCVTIFIGVATRRATGASGARRRVAKRRLSGTDAPGAEVTAKLSAFVVFILYPRGCSLMFYGVDGHRWVEERRTRCPAVRSASLFVNVFVFVSAFFLDFLDRVYRDPVGPGRAEVWHRPDLGFGVA